jgi:hypothetical protein
MARRLVGMGAPAEGQGTLCPMGARSLDGRVRAGGKAAGQQAAAVVCPTTSGQVRLWARICALFVPAPLRFGYCRGGPAPTTTQIRQAVAEIEQALVDAERVFLVFHPRYALHGHKDRASDRCRVAPTEQPQVAP